MPVAGVAETTLGGFDAFELEQYQAQLTEVQTPETPIEKKQEPVKRQEPSKQRQKKRAMKRDRGMEL